MKVMQFSAIPQAAVPTAGKQYNAPPSTPMFAGADGGTSFFVIGAGALGKMLAPVIMPINFVSGKKAIAKLNSGWKSVSGQDDQAKAEFLKKAATKARLHRSYGAEWTAGKVPEVQDDKVKTLLIIHLLSRHWQDSEVTNALEAGVNSVQAGYADDLKTAYNLTKTNNGGFQACEALREKLEDKA
jgi:hypothetical protein